MKIEIFKGFRTVEMRVPLDGADGWVRGWITYRHQTPLHHWRQHSGEGSGMDCAH